MAENRFQDFTSVDFDKIKESLVNYMKSRQKDGKLEGFEFEGSTMNMVMDLLAYNTQYNAFYLNMLASERFISTAQKRTSVVNLAKNMGYTPISTKPATAFLDIDFTITSDFLDESPTNVIVIPKGTQFTGANDSRTLTFITDREYLIEPEITNNTDGSISLKYSISKLEIIEGSQLTFTETIPVGSNGITIPNKGVDIDRIRVFAGAADAAQLIEYRRQSDFARVTKVEKVFFVDEVDGELHKVYFGDDVIGAGVISGSQVRVEYHLSSGSDGNGVKRFSLASEIPGVQSINITFNTPSNSGADIEDIDSIRISAPAFFQRQNRAVTVDDFKSITQEIFPAAVDVNAFGGEDAEVPAFGRVFISILQDLNALPLSDIRKREIESTIKDRYAAFSITPTVIEPNFVYLEVKTLIDFDSRISNPGALNIRDNAKAAALQFIEQSTNKFKGSFRNSKFGRIIDDSDQSILSSQTQVDVFLEFTEPSQITNVESLSLNQPIIPGTIRTNTFSFRGFLAVIEPNDEDNRFLSVKIITPNLSRITLPGAERVARVDYSNGSVTLLADRDDLPATDFLISERSPLRLFASVVGGDVVAINNNVVRLREENLKVEVVDVLTGNKTGVINFGVNDEEEILDILRAQDRELNTF